MDRDPKLRPQMLQMNPHDFVVAGGDIEPVFSVCK